MDRTARCPKCNSDMEISQDVGKKDLVWCETCYGEFVVMSVNPLILEATEDDQENEEGTFGE